MLMWLHMFKFRACGLRKARTDVMLWCTCYIIRPSDYVNVCATFAIIVICEALNVYLLDLVV